MDDEPSVVRLLTEVLRQEGYACFGCQSGQEAMRLMNSRGFDVVLCDIHMPGMSGLDLLHFVREKHPRSASVMVTGEGDIRVGVQAMKEGADDYILKPLNFEAVLLSIKQVLERKRLEGELADYRLRLETMVEQRTAQLRGTICRIERNYDETLQTLTAALDLRDRETAGHSARVMAYALEIAKMVGCSKAQLTTVARGALLHDIGKIGVPDAILMKAGPLTEDEWPLMKAHVGVGFWLLNRIAFLEDAAEIVHAHHERFDGKGYPRGLQGGMIPLGARIFSVADTLDAITSDRPYRRAMPFAVAREEIVGQSGKQFDPDVVSAFLTIDEGIWHEIRMRKGVIRSPQSAPWLHMPADHLPETFLQPQAGA
ncbi:MAG: HD domain-containing phosphohydrolase [Terriglobia bacterium]